MKRRFIIVGAMLIALLMLVVPGLVLAHSQAVSSTEFFACENTTTGAIDELSITQNDALDCTTRIDVFNTTVHWSVTGPQGDPGIQGIQGLKGDKGDTGATGSQGLPGNDGTNGTDGTNGVDGTPGATGPIGPAGPTGNTGPTGTNGIPFSHAPCTEIKTGSTQQENLLFCKSGIEPDGGFVYIATMNAATSRVIMGIPIYDGPCVDWGNVAETCVAFTSGMRAEYHADHIVRFYNAANQRVF